MTTKAALHRAQAVAAHQTSDFGARVLALAEAFAAGALRPSDLGLWHGPADRALGRLARRRLAWLDLLRAEPDKTFGELLLLVRSDLAEAVAALGPRHAAHVAWLWEQVAKAVVLAAIMTVRAKKPEDAREFFRSSLSDPTLMAGLMASAQHERWIDPTPLLEEATGRSAQTRLRALDRAYMRAIRHTWSTLAGTRPLPPITLRGDPSSHTIARWRPNAWPRARLEMRVDAIARTLEALAHPRLGNSVWLDIAWGWDPCLYEAYSFAEAKLMDPLETICHEILHAADAWEVGKWSVDARGIPGILASFGSAGRIWLAADKLTARGAKNLLRSPWPYESLLYEGWTTARAQILAPRVQASISGLPSRADFAALDAPEYPQPYATATAILRRLFRDDELLSLDARTFRTTFLARIRSQLGSARAAAVENVLDIAIGPGADMLPAKLKAQDSWPWLTSPEPVRQATYEIFNAHYSTGIPDWDPVLVWLDEATVALP